MSSSSSSSQTKLVFPTRPETVTSAFFTITILTTGAGALQFKLHEPAQDHRLNKSILPDASISLDREGAKAHGLRPSGQVRQLCVESRLNNFRRTDAWVWMTEDILSTSVYVHRSPPSYVVESIAAFSHI